MTVRQLDGLIMRTGEDICLNCRVSGKMVVCLSEALGDFDDLSLLRATVSKHVRRVKVSP